ncbi:immunoglobulin-binding protein 1-like [Portunus trituberculatus]|uniref:immunoglobulin-binding protein 1-like n=1 Tax=Portunus trituberculatus TaxID=210409 RepID=UPI001E1CFE9C|nr:immunoglobulin-binding protein 1-like [Portunus trituberculatus]
MAGEEASVAAAFDKYLALYREIEASTLPTVDPHLQSQIKTAIAGLIRTTVVASETGIFSTNETLDDLPTSSIKLLLLPALLGTLTLKRTDTDRPEVLRLATVYLRDFLRRCSEYGVVKGCFQEEEEEDEEEEEEEEEEVVRGGGGGGGGRSKPSPQELQAMARQRQDKIQRFREKKELEGRLAELQKALEKKGLDEDVLREYQLKLVRKFVYESVEELDSVTMERQMLKKISLLKLKDSTAITTTTTTKPAAPLKPILITRDACQKNVFGLGYPSRPTMTVEEFYDQRVKDGWFPDPRRNHGCLQDRATFTQEEEEAVKEEEEEEEERKEEEDDPDNLERLRERDEWRDTHRRGWGNTFNRS